MHRHLFDVDSLSRDELERILDLSVEMRDARAERRHRTLLEDEVVALAFYEASTRTRVSFELAARALGATVVDLAIAGSSVIKGESLADTLRTLERTGVTTAVLRHPQAGAPQTAAQATGLRIINAGDGAHAHPTQALADLLTLREAIGSIEDRVVAIVGDVAHSRVARSNIHALTAMGASVRVAGPREWTEGFAAWPAVQVMTTLDDALTGADAVMALRVQTERLDESEAIDLTRYVRDWRLDSDRLGMASPGAPLLHPGPTNEGVEITSEVAGGPRSLIGRQVANGVPVRMAVLALVCEAG